MRITRTLCWFLLLNSILLCPTVLWSAESSAAREIPRPLPHRPGNVFLAGEEISVPLSESNSGWRLSDYEGHTLGEVTSSQGRATLGQLPVGCYRLDQPGGSNWISVGVVGPLRAPTPNDSPVALDVAMSWFYDKKQMDAVANLCALAGVNWVRDRLTWAELEPAKGAFAASTRYDASARVQSRAGLRVLQVIHLSPHWANPNSQRFPLDLRDGFRFYEAMARRWRAEVQAFEPWNEADIPMFGGHTGSEMATLQKAAYLGLKAGNPKMIACMNVFALHNPLQLEDFHANAAWPYFDTFNLHHYAPFDEYPQLYGEFRAVAAGKPLWVSECALPVKWSGDDKLKEPTDADLRVQSERVAKTFASSLHEGATATFYFLLPHYVEGQTQFGILRPDLTPRPAYVALAAVGRFLAHATPLGRLQTTNQSIRAFLFRAQPDGLDRDVLVAWATKADATLTLPVRPEQVFDHLGRDRQPQEVVTLSTAPLFLLLPTESNRLLALSPPPQNAPFLSGHASPVVLQALWPENKLDLKQSAYRISTNKTETIPVFAYNFGPETVHGSFRLEQPTSGVVFTKEVELAPLERKELALTVDPRTDGSISPLVVRIVGNFSSAGQPVLSLRLLPVNP